MPYLRNCNQSPNVCDLASYARGVAPATRPTLTPLAPNRSPVTFLDFEASGLRGFPIEIGWAVVHPDNQVVVESYLIHCETWMDQIDRWDHCAESIHGIPRRILIEFGKSPDDVARLTNKALAGTIVYVDSSYDAKWSAELFAEAKMAQAFAFADIAVAFSGPEIDEMAYDHALKIIDKIKPRTHRAGEDAEHWATLYRMSLRGGGIAAVRVCEGLHHR